jgi:hypothetical protein
MSTRNGQSVRPVALAELKSAVGLYLRQAPVSMLMLIGLKSSGAVFCANSQLSAGFFALPLTSPPNYHGDAAFSVKLAGSTLSYISSECADLIARPQGEALIV